MPRTYFQELFDADFVRSMVGNILTSYNIWRVNKKVIQLQGVNMQTPSLTIWVWSIVYVEVISYLVDSIFAGAIAVSHDCLICNWKWYAQI